MGAIQIAEYAWMTSLLIFQPVVCGVPVPGVCDGADGVSPSGRAWAVFPGELCDLRVL